MSDRPDLMQLLDAVQMHVETNVLPAIRDAPRLYFQTLVALNLLRIGQRELAQGAAMRRAEWMALDGLTGRAAEMPASDEEMAQRLAARRKSLCAAIRHGEYDSPVDAVRLTAYLQGVVSAELALNNPKLAGRIASEISGDSYAE